MKAGPKNEIIKTPPAAKAAPGSACGAMGVRFEDSLPIEQSFEARIEYDGWCADRMIVEANWHPVPMIQSRAWE